MTESVPSEKAILGLTIVEPDQHVDQLSDLLDLLQSDTHRFLASRLVQLYQKHKSLDLIILHDSLTKEELKEIGGSGYLASLVSGLPEKPNWDALAANVRAAYKTRRYKDLADRLCSALASGESNEALDAIITSAKDDKADVVNAPNIAVAAENAARNVDEIRNVGVDLHFGVSQLDSTLGGIRRKKLYTVGGRTSQGKTTVCANIIQNNLIQNKDAKIYYNGFENIDEIPIRLASINSNVKLETFIKPHEAKEEDYCDALVALEDLKGFEDRLLISFGDSVSQMRQVCKSYRPDIVFVDYIQRLAHKYNLGGSDRLSHAIGKAVSDLQDIAIDYNCAMFCCSQFRRSASEFRGKEPSIEDLKESGDIENESDNIILLWWPWRETLDDKRHIQDQYRFLIRKNKLGPCGDIPSKINLETLKITDWGI